MTSPALRDRYLGDTVSTASPGRLLVMLYERLVLDLSQAETAMHGGDRGLANDRLVHAQDIIMELRTTLDLSAWDGAAGLARIYAFLLGELIAANVHADVDRVVSCRELIEPLLDAWRQATAAVAAVAQSPSASGMA
jgi:flagellar protein FliS